MMVIEEKLNEIKDSVNDTQIARIKEKMENPERVLCPFNRRYAQLPFICTGYRYVCPHLDRKQIVCNHPENKKWKEEYSGPRVRVLVR
ncbi:MAG: hypothetical protein JW932_16835 [Deltaproteobacteria bacterium]|nr:hypothetical protein [Deltaproteobacteria bacterium]